MTWEFRSDRNLSGVLHIVDELIDNEGIAKQRAEAELLDGAYWKRTCTFRTYLTDINIGDIVNVEGLPYKVVAVELTAMSPSIVSKITGVRYE